MRSDSGNGKVDGQAAGERGSQRHGSAAGKVDGTAGGSTVAGDAGTAILARLGEIAEALGVLTDREQERAAHRETVIDRLHADNLALRRNELDTMLDPVRGGLYRLHDLARREAQRWSGPDRPDPEHAGPLLELIAEEVLEVLARTGVEPFGAEPGEPYDSARHRPLDTEDVTREDRDGAVVRVVNQGFLRGEKVVRRADVVVGRLTTRRPAGQARRGRKAPAKPAQSTPTQGTPAEGKPAQGRQRGRKQGGKRGR